MTSNLPIVHFTNLYPLIKLSILERTTLDTSSSKYHGVSLNPSVCYLEVQDGPFRF